MMVRYQRMIPRDCMIRGSGKSLLKQAPWQLGKLSLLWCKGFSESLDPLVEVLVHETDILLLQSWSVGGLVVVHTGSLSPNSCPKGPRTQIIGF